MKGLRCFSTCYSINTNRSAIMSILTLIYRQWFVPSYFSEEKKKKRKKKNHNSLKLGQNEKGEDIEYYFKKN